MKDPKLIDAALVKWGNYRRCADRIDIGYPHQSAEQMIPGPSAYDPDFTMEERVDMVVANMSNLQKIIVFSEYVWGGSVQTKVNTVKKKLNSHISERNYYTYLKLAKHYLAGKLEDYLAEVA